MAVDSAEFVCGLVLQVEAFCHSLDSALPAYSYVPCSTDEQRVRVMQSRLFNEGRAADLFGTWLRSTPEPEIKEIFAESAHEETEHGRLLAARISQLGAEPYDYRPLPAQVAMFNALELLPDTVQRLAGFSLAGEAVAIYLIRKSLEEPSVPEWIKEPYRRITEDEQGHGSMPQEMLRRYATTDLSQDAARRAVAMRLVLFREYLASLDRWALNQAEW